ncbi:MAG: hypothetical protein WCE52_05055 [Candidatus Acidiferrum sp.]
MELWEVALASAIVFIVFFLRNRLHSLKYVALCSFGAFLIGLTVGSLMLLRKKSVVAGTKEYEDRGGSIPDLSLWKQWLNFSRAAVDYEFRLLLLSCYFLIIGPLAIVFRLGSGESSHEDGKSSWIARSEDSSLDAAGRPF